MSTPPTVALAAWPNVALVSWDVDGTLYRSAAMKRRVALAAARAPLRAARELLRVRRFHWAVEACRAGGGVLGDAGARLGRQESLEVEARWVRPALAAVGPLPGLLRALAAVAARGLPQVVFSDYEANYKLEALGIAGCFAAAFAGETLGYVKPHPEGLEAMARAYGLAPSAILHIGDRDETDGAAARAAGAQYVVLGRDVADLWELAERFGAAPL